MINIYIRLIFLIHVSYNTNKTFCLWGSNEVQECSFLLVRGTFLRTKLSELCLTCTVRAEIELANLMLVIAFKL